jgi:DNA-binding HxlR family transcriptional regulator
MEGYGQFCPVAMASEVLTRRWTPLIIRELLCGSHRFNELHRGMPRVSRTLLSQRLTDLEDAGVIERRIASDGHPEYHLTPAGEELRPVIESLGVWGKRWSGVPRSDDLDPSLLMWDMRRRIVSDRLPEIRVVVHFHFVDARMPQHDYWLLLRKNEVDVCFEDPRFACDLEVDTDLRTLTDVWMGDCPLAEAMRREELRLKGPSRLRGAFPGWLGLSMFASEPRMR